MSEDGSVLGEVDTQSNLRAAKAKLAEWMFSQDKYPIVERLQESFLLLWRCWKYSMQQQALQIHQRQWGIIELAPRGSRVTEC